MGMLKTKAKLKFFYMQMEVLKVFILHIFSESHRISLLSVNQKQKKIETRNKPAITLMCEFES